ADALQGALQPAGRRGLVFETSIETPPKYFENLTPSEGKKPERRLWNSRLLAPQKTEKAPRVKNPPDQTKPKTKRPNRARAAPNGLKLARLTPAMVGLLPLPIRPPRF